MKTRALTISLVATALVAAGCSSGGTSIFAAKGSTAGGAPAAGSVTSGAATSSAANSSAAKSSAAHSSSAPAAKSGSTVDVCSLLSATQASTINNVPYSGATPQHIQAGYDSCTYKNAGSAPDPIDIQNLTVTLIAIGGCWTGLQSADGPGTPVTGIGDAAFGYMIGIDVKLGDRCLEVSGLTHAEFNDNYGPDVQMATIIVGGLH